MIHVTFVCLGNICRSPMAEAVLQQMVNAAGLADQFMVDSAGTSGWHAGEPAHSGTRRVLSQHGITYRGSARQVAWSDVRAENGYIIAMDGHNVADLQERFGSIARLYPLLEFASETDEVDVPDPYYTGGFDYVYSLVSDGCRGLLNHIIAEHVLQPTAHVILK